MDSAKLSQVLHPGAASARSAEVSPVDAAPLRVWNQ